MQSKIAIAVGDPNGIGPEIAVKAAAAAAGSSLQAVLVGDEHIIRHYAPRHAAGLALRPFNAAAPTARALSYVAFDALAHPDFIPNMVSAAAGCATVAYVAASQVATALAGRPQECGADSFASRRLTVAQLPVR
jgi:4-hydroxy-L-threonine phosphate dehydrogenase PdxA